MFHGLSFEDEDGCLVEVSTINMYTILTWCVIPLLAAGCVHQLLQRIVFSCCQDQTGYGVELAGDLTEFSRLRYRSWSEVGTQKKKEMLNGLLPVV